MVAAAESKAQAGKAGPLSAVERPAPRAARHRRSRPARHAAPRAPRPQPKFSKSLTVTGGGKGMMPIVNAQVGHAGGDD
jgi:hypothetical protein